MFLVCRAYPACQLWSVADTGHPFGLAWPKGRSLRALWGRPPAIATFCGGSGLGPSPGGSACARLASLLLPGTLPLGLAPVPVPLSPRFFFSLKI